METSKTFICCVCEKECPDDELFCTGDDVCMDCVPDAVDDEDLLRVDPLECERD